MNRFPQPPRFEQGKPIRAGSPKLIRIEYQPSVHLMHALPASDVHQPSMYYSRQYDAKFNSDARISTTEQSLRRRGRQCLQLAGIQSIRIGDKTHATVLRCPVVGASWHDELDKDLTLLDERFLFVGQDQAEIDDFYGIEVVYSAALGFDRKRLVHQPALVDLDQTLKKAVKQEQPLYTVTNPRIARFER